MVHPTRYDWIFIKKILKIQKKNPNPNLPFAALTSKEENTIKMFADQHYSQFAFKKDFQRFVDEVKTLLKISAYSGSFASVLKSQLKASIFRTKVSIGEKFFGSSECVKQYIDSFKKLQK